MVGISWCRKKSQSRAACLTIGFNIYNTGFVNDMYMCGVVSTDNRNLGRCVSNPHDCGVVDGLRVFPVVCRREVAPLLNVSGCG